MKKFNFRKVLDGLTASSPGSGSSGGSNSSGGAGSGSVHPGGTAGILREEIQETLTSEYFQICKVSLELGWSLYFSILCCEKRITISTKHNTLVTGNCCDAIIRIWCRELYGYIILNQDITGIIFGTDSTNNDCLRGERELRDNVQ